MNPTVFFENFELLADAPNGIQKLRELILRLAVMGKLVEQDPRDEPASVLLEKVIAEKEKLMQERKIRKSESLYTINQEKGFNKLPIGWKWVSIGEISILQGGKRLPKGADFSLIPTSHAYIQVTNMKNGTVDDNGLKYIDEDVYNSIKKYIIERDDLYITIAGTIGQVGEIPERFHGMNLTENAAKIVFRGFAKKYLLLAIRSDLIQMQFGEKTNQQAQPKLALKRIESTIIPLPPLAEQKRIVTKVDEMMVLCDKLENHRQRKQELQSKLNSAALDRMLSAENQEEFEHYWQHICENFDLLYDNPENVEKLKQAILQLAVQGKLVEQNPEDEPASVLIEKIEAEKDRLTKKGEMKRTKTVTFVDVSEIPYDLPKSWEWVRVDQIARNVEYGTSEKASESADGIPVLRMNNVQNGKIVYGDLKYLPESIKDLPRLFLKHNDLLFNRTNSYELVGKTGIFKGEDDTFTLASYLIRVSLFNEQVIPDFINLSINSDFFRKTQIEPEITQQCGQANFNGTKLKNSLIPLPPLAEQKRIVEKVEQLMGLCDELEAKLRKEREESQKLVEAVVKGLLENAAAGKPEVEMVTPIQAAVIQSK